MNKHHSHQTHVPADKSKTMWIVAIIVGALAIGGFLVWGAKKEAEPGKYDTFAKCLAEKQVTMYGAAWCSHCQNEKKAFGASFKYVPYVECPDNPKVCLDKGVNGYPTWIFPDGKKLEGEQGLLNLSKESGCPLPQ